MVPYISGISSLNATNFTVSEAQVAGTLKLGSGWRLFQSGASLYFQYNGNNVMRLDNNGALNCENNVTAFKAV